MVDISTLNHGDRVKIVDKWVDGCYHNLEGRMDKYLGTEMTVDRLNLFGGAVKMEEDGGSWDWYPNSIEYAVQDDEFEGLDPSALMELYGQAQRKR